MDGGTLKGRVRSEINVTPLVDIVLVLLIIFLVITPVVHDSVRLPLAKHAQRKQGGKPLTLTLSVNPGTSSVQSLTIEEPDAEGQILPLGDAARLRTMTCLRRYLAACARGEVFIKADASLRFEEVNALLQLCKEGGASEVSLITGEEPKESAKGGQS